MQAVLLGRERRWLTLVILSIRSLVCLSPDKDIETAYPLEPRDITTYLRKTNIQTRCTKTAYFTRAFDLECGEDMLSRIQSKIL